MYLHRGEPYEVLFSNAVQNYNFFCKLPNVKRKFIFSLIFVASPSNPKGGCRIKKENMRMQRIAKKSTITFAYSVD